MIVFIIRLILCMPLIIVAVATHAAHKHDMKRRDEWTFHIEQLCPNKEE